MACNVVFCVNAKFGALTPVVIESILLNSTVECRFFVVYSGLTEETRKQCQIVAAGKFKGRPEQKHEVIFVKFDPQKALSGEDGKSLAAKFRGGFDTYTRIFLPDLLKEYGVDRCLYLDVDLVANRNIDELLLMANQEQHSDSLCIGGVLNSVTRNGQKTYTNEKERDFNAGMLVLNLAWMRETGFTRKCLEFISKTGGSGFDQETINKVTPIECKTVLPDIFNEISSDKKYFSKAAIIHYTAHIGQ